MNWAELCAQPIIEELDTIEGKITQGFFMSKEDFDKLRAVVDAAKITNNMYYCPGLEKALKDLGTI